MHCDSFIAQSLSFPSQDAFVMWCGGNTKLSSEVCDRFGSADALLVPPAIAGLVQQQLGGEPLTVRDGAEPLTLQFSPSDRTFVILGTVILAVHCGLESLTKEFLRVLDRSFVPVSCEALIDKPLLGSADLRHDSSIRAFRNSIQLRDGVDKDKLVSVELPLSACDYGVHVSGLLTVSALGDGAFRRCKWLKRITLEGLPQLLSLGNQAFSCCWGLETVLLRDLPLLGVIEDRCFESCEFLLELSFCLLPSLKRIGSDAFWNCSSLKMLNLGMLPALEMLGERAFGDCRALERVEVNIQSLQEVSRLCFANCTSLARVTVKGKKSTLRLPPQVDDRAFEGTSINIGAYSSTFNAKEGTQSETSEKSCCCC